MASIPASAVSNDSIDGQLMINPMIVNDKSDLLMVLLQFRNGSEVRERRSTKILTISFDRTRKRHDN